MNKAVAIAVFQIETSLGWQAPFSSAHVRFKYQTQRLLRGACRGGREQCESRAAIDSEG